MPTLLKVYFGLSSQKGFINISNVDIAMKQSRDIVNFMQDKCKNIVGPIVGHGSDGSRRRQLMLED